MEQLTNHCQSQSEFPKMVPFLPLLPLPPKNEVLNLEPIPICVILMKELIKNKHSSPSNFNFPLSLLPPYPSYLLILKFPPLHFFLYQFLFLTIAFPKFFPNLFLSLAIPIVFLRFTP